MCPLRKDDPNSFLFFFPQQLNTTIKVTMNFFLCLQWLPQQQSDRLWIPGKSLHTFLPSGHLPFSQSSVIYSVLYNYTIPDTVMLAGGKQKLLAKLWEETVIYSIFYTAPFYLSSPVHTDNHTYRQVYQHLCGCKTNILPFGCSPLLKVAN